ncbi:hypothetical protein [Burkholderia ubonensis]|uniref:hypothetical protein n=1 Tax=Burkholderia ubonensis TaxID=101571 RepID=UPI0012FBC409
MFSEEGQTQFAAVTEKMFDNQFRQILLETISDRRSRLLKDSVNIAKGFALEVVDQIHQAFGQRLGVTATAGILPNELLGQGQPLLLRYPRQKLVKSKKCIQAIFVPAKVPSPFFNNRCWFVRPLDQRVIDCFLDVFGKLRNQIPRLLLPSPVMYNTKLFIKTSNAGDVIHLQIVTNKTA